MTSLAVFLSFLLASTVHGLALQNGYNVHPSEHQRPWGYTGPPSNHLRPWGYTGPPSNHLRPWGRPNPPSNPGKLMLDSDGNYRSQDLGQFGSVNYPAMDNVQVLPGNLNQGNFGYQGPPSNHIRPWPQTNTGYQGPPSNYLKPWNGIPATGMQVDTKPASLPPVQSGLPPVKSAAVPAVQSAFPPVLSGLPPVQSGLPAVQSGLPAVQSGLPPVQSGLPPVQSGISSVTSRGPRETPPFQTLPGSVGPTWRKSYTPLPGTGNCFNRCKNRCGSPWYSGCRPSCRSGCNIRPTCGRQQQQQGNWMYSGNTLYCGGRQQVPRWAQQPTYQPAQTLPYPIQFDNGYNRVQTLPSPIQFDDGQNYGRQGTMIHIDGTKDNENKDDGSGDDLGMENDGGDEFGFNK